MGRLFGTDGVRGIANTELTCELAFSIGQGRCLCIVRTRDHIPKIVIGKDNQVIGDMLKTPGGRYLFLRCNCGMWGLFPLQRWLS